MEEFSELWQKISESSSVNCKASTFTYCEVKFEPHFTNINRKSFQLLPKMSESGVVTSRASTFTYLRIKIAPTSTQISQISFQLLLKVCGSGVVNLRRLLSFVFGSNFTQKNENYPKNGRSSAKNK